MVASRYRDNGEADGLANRSRVGVSHAATRLTKIGLPPAPPGGLGPDEWVLRPALSAVDIDSLRPVGFKILLEAVARCRLRVAEVGFTFAPRHSGESKADFREGLRFAIHLARLRLGTILTARQHAGGRLRRRRAPPDWSSIPSPSGSSSASATCPICGGGPVDADLHHLELRRAWSSSSSPAARPADSGAATGGSACSTTPSCWLGCRCWPSWSRVVHTPETVANVITLLAVFVVRFGISDRFIYEGEEEEHGQCRNCDHQGRTDRDGGGGGRSRAVEPQRATRDAVPLPLRPARDRDHRQ